MIQTKQNSIIGIWLLEESLDELRKILNFDLLPKNEYSSLKSIKRKKEWLAVRVLIKHIFKSDDILINYNNQGKPLLSNNFNVSITHSGSYIAVITNKTKPVGIDIQIAKKNIKAGMNLFMSPTETKEIGSSNLIEKLHIYWCAKETLYKYVGNKNLNIYSDFIIDDFVLNDNKLIWGVINNTDEKVQLEYLITDDFYLVNTL